MLPVLKNGVLENFKHFVEVAFILRRQPFPHNDFLYRKNFLPKKSGFHEGKSKPERLAGKPAGLLEIFLGVCRIRAKEF